MYETMYSKAGGGAILHTKRVLSPEAIRTMHLPATDEAGGMGVTSMLQMVNAGVWLVTMRSRTDMAKAMRLPNEKLVQAHIAQYLLPQVQLMLNRVHRIASAAHRASIEKDIPKAAAAFMKSRTNPRTIRKRLMTVGAKNEAAQVEAHAYAHSDDDLAGDIYAAQASRKQTVHAANVWTNSRSSHETKVSNAAFILQMSTLLWLDGRFQGRKICTGQNAHVRVWKSRWTATTRTRAKSPGESASTTPCVTGLHG